MNLHSDTKGFDYCLRNLFSFLVNFLVFQRFVRRLEGEAERQIAFAAVLWNVEITKFCFSEIFAFIFLNGVKNCFYRQVLLANKGNITAHGRIHSKWRKVRLFAKAQFF